MRDARRGGLGIALVGVLLVAGIGAGVAGATSDPGSPGPATISGSVGPAATTLLAPGSAAGDPPSGDRSSATQGGTIMLEQTFHLTPNRPGEVTIEQTYGVPDRIVSMNATLPSNATVVSTDGFTRVEADTYGWDGRTANPSVTYRYAVNRTGDTAGLEAANGTYLSVDTGDWALFVRPVTSVEYTATGDSNLDYQRHTSVAGQGVTGQWLVYLGPYRTARARAHSQTFDLVIPDAAQLRERPADILASLTNASDSLRIGDRDENVTIVAAPTAGVDWAVRGLETGDSDAWVRDNESLDTPENVWLHEYVHTRQDFRPTRATRWITEGSATYYAAMLTSEQNRTTFPALRSHLAWGQRDRFDAVVLADPSTWSSRANYERGALVIAQLDRQIRARSDHERTFQTVLGEMNQRSGPVTQDRFLSMLAETGGEPVGQQGREYTATATSVEIWNRSQYLAAFSETPARISYSLPPLDRPSAYLVSGPYRDGNVGGDDRIELVTGEELSVAARVRNDGGTEGSYDVALTVNGTVVRSQEGRIGPGRTRTVVLEHRFPTPGRFVVGVGGENVTVIVRRPARAHVRNLSVAPPDGSAYRQGTTIRARATVSNDADRPGAVRVVFTRNFQGVETRQVRLAANETRQVVARISLPRAGPVRLGINGVDTLRIDVGPAPVQTATANDTRDPTPTATPTATPTGTGIPTTSTTPATGRGFGAVIALVALLAAALLARRQ